jgi:NADH:ubiquinone oxidoreductase subunit 6 (subunit J)
MSRSRKVALGVATVWPLVYMAFFFVWLAIQFTTPGAMEGFTAVMVVHIVTFALGIGLIVFYAIHASNTDRLSGDERTLWLVLLIVMNVFAAPVYWFLYIWREAPLRSGGQRGQHHVTSPRDVLG